MIFGETGIGPSRRHVLQGAGMASAVFALAACSGAQAQPPTTATDVSKTQRSLRFDDRYTYRNTVGEDFPLVEAFSAASGLAVTFTGAVSDDNVYWSKVKNQLKSGHDVGADAVVLADWMAARWIRLGYVQQFRHDNLSNFTSLRSRFQDAEFDPGRRSSMPWRAGFTGIAWNTAAIPEGLTSISDLWDPSLRGKVGVLSAMRETVGSIMMDQDVDIASPDWGDAEFSAAIDVVSMQLAEGQLHGIKGNRYKEDLVSGDTVAAIARVGDIMQLNEEAGGQWAFALPTKGGVLSSDSVVIPMGAAHRTNVEEFVNFYCDPVNAVKVVEATNFISPVNIGEPYLSSIPESVASNHMLFPTDATLANTRSFRTLTLSEEQRYDSQFQGVLLGGM